MVPHPSCSPARSCWIRAFDRAAAEHLIPFRTAPTTWTVKTYTVRVVGAGWSDLACTCPAGRTARVCKHAAVVAAAIARGISPIKGTERATKSTDFTDLTTLAPFVLQPSRLVAGVASSLAEAFA